MSRRHSTIRGFMAFKDIPGFGILGVFLLTISTWNNTGE